MNSQTQSGAPSRRVPMQEFYINIGPNPFSTACRTFSKSNAWLLIGILEELAIFEGVYPFDGCRPVYVRGTEEIYRSIRILCDPNLPAGKVLIDLAKDIACEAKLEAEHQARNDPNEVDYCPPYRDWLWPVQRTLALGGKLKPSVQNAYQSGASL